MNKRKIIILITSIILIITLVFIVLSKNGYQFSFNSDDVSVKYFDNTNINRTTITPHMEVKIDVYNNIIYCSTFQLSWNEIKNILGGNIELENSSEIDLYLNRSLSTNKDLSDSSYVAVGGLIKDGVEDTINNQLSDKFKNANLVNFDGLGEKDIVAYSYLFKKLEFETEFESIKDPLFFDDVFNSEIKAFGIEKYSNFNKKMGQQVEIIDYVDDNDFIISLKTKSLNDELILAKVAPDETLLSTIESVGERIDNGYRSELIKDDILIIPKFSFDISYEYNELKNQHVINEGFEDYLISQALQDISFNLNEEGAVLESKAFLSMIKAAPRCLVFDQPFLLYMKEKDAEYPYFAMWVNNTELMTIYN